MNKALVLIDLQKGFDELENWNGHRNNPKAEETAAELLNHFRKNNLPIFHVKHCSTKPNSPLVKGKPGNEIRAIVAPIEGEAVIEKSVHSAFIGTDLEKRLRTLRIDQLYIAGMTTDHCVSTTVRMAGDFGFEVFLVADASATFDRIGIDGQRFDAELVHQTALSSLDKEFCSVILSSEVLK